jgi:hypothetical protein
MKVNIGDGSLEIGNVCSDKHVQWNGEVGKGATPNREKSDSDLGILQNKAAVSHNSQ